MNEINLKVTVDEANLVLEGLGHLPFAKVFALVAKLQEQARSQLDGKRPEAAGKAPVQPAAEGAAHGG